MFHQEKIMRLSTYYKIDALESANCYFTSIEYIHTINNDLKCAFAFDIFS